MKRSCSTSDDSEEIIVVKKSHNDGAINLDLKINNEDSDSNVSECDNDDDEEDGDETPGGSSNSNFPARLGKCEVCAAQEARYTCPKCEVKTCCLNCVRIHKKELECDGIRDRTKFIPLKDMTKMDFISDYYFLEECTRYVEDRKVDRVKRYTRFNTELPIHLYRLRQAAKERKCTLKILIQNFARHKENTTYYDWKTKKIWWRVKWIFVNAGNLCYVDEKCLEDEYLRDLLRKYIDKDCPKPVAEKKKLEFYQSKGVQGLSVMLKSEGIKGCKNRYYLLDVNKTLRSNLKHKTLVEYPLIYVSYEEDPCGFDIIDSDEDVEGETKQHQDLLEQYRKTALEKQKRQQADGSEEDGDDNEETPADVENLVKLQAENRRKERQRKRAEYEKQQSHNFLFTDEQLMEALSSSSSEDEEG